MQQVTKNQFIQVLHNYPESTTADAQEVIALKNSFPFSQVLHALAARLSKDHKLESHTQELQMAAVYAADRGVLKTVMTQTSAAWPLSKEIAGQDHHKTPLSISAEKPNVEKKGTHPDVADEVIQDLNRLHELRHNFESLFIDVEETSLTKAHEPSKADNTTITEDSVEKRKLPGGRKRGNSKAKRIIELAKSLETEDTPEQDSTKSDIIEEIKSTKKKIKPETEKQREQLEIINQFIKSQPSISHAKDKIIPPPAGDLSVKSGEFSDHIISETLVEILLNQGKKEKAIEVLKKLIWKFPQKKSYFAAQIEELKKNII